MTLSLGPGWYAPKGKQNIYIDVDVVNTYQFLGRQRALMAGEFFVGIQRDLWKNILGQVGLSLYSASNAVIDLDVWQEADPNYNNFFDAFNLAHNAISLKGKLISLHVHKYLQPYLAASAGYSVNQSSGYSTVPKSFEVIANPVFLSNTTNTYTYSFEIGSQAKWTDNWVFGFAYVFSDFGESTVKPFFGQTTSATPGLNHFYVNQFQINISYLLKPE